MSQFLRELHFIEARGAWPRPSLLRRSQFLRELHFIEADNKERRANNSPGRSSFGNCTSLRPERIDGGDGGPVVAVPSGTALH